MRVVIIFTINVLFLLSVAIATSAEESIEFPFTRRDLALKLDNLSRDTGVRTYLGRPSRCGDANLQSGVAYFCDYSVLTMRIRVWCKSEDGPVVLISSYPSNLTTPSIMILSYSALISALDPDLSEAQVTDMAERLGSAGRTLSGKIEESGKNARYSTRVTRNGLLFMTAP